jgi:cytochrome b561
MPLRTRPDGYGLVAKTLHWVTVAALTTQLGLSARFSRCCSSSP